MLGYILHVASCCCLRVCITSTRYTYEYILGASVCVYLTRLRKEEDSDTLSDALLNDALHQDTERVAYLQGRPYRPVCLYGSNFQREIKISHTWPTLYTILVFFLVIISPNIIYNLKRTFSYAGWLDSLLKELLVQYFIAPLPPTCTSMYSHRPGSAVATRSE